MTSEARPDDEIANLLTHGLGFLLSLAASAWLLRAVSGQRREVVVACGIYCATLVLLYGSSTLSHAFQELHRRRFYRTLDQACIFLLIAGSFTPVATVYLNHGSWRLLLVAMWACAVAGVCLVLRMRNLTAWAKAAYGVMGWLPVIAIEELLRQAPGSLVFWMVAGGLCYSIGAIFLSLSGTVRYAHAIWHSLVIAGSACHYCAIWIAATSG